MIQATKWGRIVLVALALAVAVAAPAYVMRKPLLTWAITQALSSQGVDGAQFKVTLVQQNVLKMEDIRLGADLSLRSLSLFFTPLGLIMGRVEAVNLVGLEINASEPEAGVLGLILKQSSSQEGDLAAALELPAINIHGALIRGSRQGVDFSILVDGRVAPDLSASLDLAAEGTMESAGESLKAQLLNARIVLETKMEDARQVSVKAVFSGDVYSPWAERFDLSADGDFSWSASGLLGELRPVLKNISFTAGDVTVRGLSAKLRIPVFKPNEEIVIGVDEGQAGLGLAGNWLFLKKMAAKVAVNPETLAVAVTLNSGTVIHDALEPLFKPVAVSGAGNLDGDALNFHAMASFLQREDGGGDILVKGKHDLALGEGRAAVTLSPLSFFPSGPFPSDLSALLNGLKEVSGSVKGETNIHWINGAYDGAAGLVLDGLSFTVGTTEVAGLSTTLRLDGLNPPFMKQFQEISAARVADAISLDNPLVRFRLKEGGDEILVKRAQAGLIDGLLAVDDASIDMSAAANKLTLKLTGMDLAKMMKLLDIDGVSGSGVLNGAMPMEIREDRVLVLDGRMDAAGPGVLRILSPQAKQALSGGGEQVDLLLQVLEDFRYKRLSLKVNNDELGESSIRLGIEGANPAVLDGFPFILNINLSTNMNRVLAMLLDVYRFSDRAMRSATGLER
ncbi:MAG TPA: hypothetical protein ENI79_06475 [Rhodospirillales bacterium]|nr:hypothetical protein [Rhodospirillales bacterium]